MRAEIYFSLLPNLFKTTLMKKLTQHEQDELLKIAKKHSKQLSEYEGVSDVSIGYPIKNGIMNFEEVAILVFVPRKFEKSMLSADQIIPGSMDGMKIDVVQIDPVDHATNDRFDPLIGGIYLSNSRLNGGGTLAMMLREKGTLKPVGLSNWHVLKDRKGKAGDVVVQPAWMPASATYSVGNLYKWDQALDCAIFTANNSRSVNSPDSMYNIPGKVTQMAALLLGTVLQKSGARTGVTHGVISSINVNNVDITISANPAKPDPNNEISLPGDSGSLWITDEATPRAVALHWGGDGENSPNSEYSYARYFQPILTKLGIEFIP